jgi:hypothetical protein
MAPSGIPPRSRGPGHLPADWAIGGWSVGGGLLVASVVSFELLGVPATTAAILAFGGVSLALLVLIAYLLLLPPVPATLPPARPGRRTIPAIARATPGPAPASVAPVPPETTGSAAVPSPPVPSPAAQLSASNAVRRAAGVAAVGASPSTSGATLTPSPSAPVEPAPVAPEPADAPSLTSIPGAYLQALGTQRDPAAAWHEVAPPIAAALPFAAGVQRLPPERSGSAGVPDEPAPGALELELARLRARVRELEGPRSPSVPAQSRTLTVPSPAAASPRGPEPPAPPAHVAAIHRGCAGCGGALASGAPPPLCWGCGRALCAGCYWRFGAGPGLHRCPDCASKAGGPSTGISGGRAGRPAAGVPTPSPTGPPTSPPAMR